MYQIIFTMYHICIFMNFKQFFQRWKDQHKYTGILYAESCKQQFLYIAFKVLFLGRRGLNHILENQKSHYDQVKPKLMKYVEDSIFIH